MSYRRVQLTKSSFDNDYIKLTEILDFFPKELFGGSNKEEQSNIKATLYFGISDAVEADIDGSKNFFRVRGPFTRRFFAAHSLQPGDFVVFEKTGQYQYHVYPQRDF